MSTGPEFDHEEALMVHLPATRCPCCGALMGNRAFKPNAKGGARRATGYDSCLRQCASCGVGYSNAQKNPKRIYKDPLRNVPPEVRNGALQILQGAINVLNHKSKLSKFGSESSEDAVTWTIFSFLHQHHADELPSLYEQVLGIREARPPALLLWGVPVHQSQREDEVHRRLIEVSDTLGEAPRRRSEPDVVLDFGDAGLAIVEVKFGSGNESKGSDNWHRYLPCPAAFVDASQAEASGLYELVRNWRIGHELAGDRPFVLVNLAKAPTLTSTKGMETFRYSLATSKDRRFLPLPWRDFLAVARRATGGFPDWIEDYLRARRLP